MIDISEKKFEATIEQSLLNSGYQKRHSKDFDKTHCLIPQDVLSFIQTTQPQEWDKFKSHYGEDAETKLLKRLANFIQNHTTLEVFRKGLKVNGCKFKLTYFQPANNLNPETQKLYQSNIFTVIRQLYYSDKNPKQSLDLTLFLNGLPIFTAELKNPLNGQTVENAIKQYKNDRKPHETLFKFGVCLSHFALDPNLVYMTTKLKGTDTYFLPFNQGQDEGAGNPPKNSDKSGYPSEYLWETIWEKNSILDLIQNFMTLVKEEATDQKSASKKLIFPRYHQLDTVRRLLADAKVHGTGKRYLIQHSAGSGKSNTIAWLAHGFSNLHDANNNRVFDSVIVVSDRRVIDRQLQNAIGQFQQTTGVVENIDQTAKQLKDALESGKNIIVTTLQKFGVIVDQIQALSGKKFAVIIDEAHSSQSGESSQNLKSVLSATTLEAAEKEDSSPEHDIEDRITEEARKRGFIQNLSYFAFTATPKKETLELFGSQQPDGSFVPFSLYSMKQAIEEGFILDVLANYTTYQSYFKLLKTIESDPKYDRQKAASLLRNFVELHEHTIKQKIATIVEHFHDHIAQQLNGKAKAMIVTRSRLHAVRYKLALDDYLRAKQLPYQSLVAFTGKVNDGAEFTETSMNTASAGTKISESATAETFKQDKYRFLIVANKFQTGFDQPLLVAMYVDKKIAGLIAVQTLSRLNRIYPGKESVFVLDFANEADDIQKAFAPYYDRTLLTEATDPNILYDLQIKLDNYHFYQPREIEQFAQIYFNTQGSQAKLYAVLTPTCDRYKQAPAETQLKFYRQLKEFINLYRFLSQLLPSPDPELEKLYHFYRYLIRLLPLAKTTLPLDIQQNIELESYRIKQTYQGQIDLKQEVTENPSNSHGKTPKIAKEEIATLSQIIQDINQQFGTNFTENERVFLEQMETTLDRTLQTSITVNDRTNIKLEFDHQAKELIQEAIDSHFELYKKFNDNQEFRAFLLGALFNRFLERANLGQKRKPVS